MRLQNKPIIFFLAAIAALTSLSIDMSLSAIPAIEHDLGQRAGHGALTLSVFLAGYAITPLIGGPLADSLGRRRVLLGSLSLFALSALFSAISRTYPQLLLFRFCQGCAAGIATTMPLAIVRDLLTGHVARQRISEVTTINSMMPLVAPVLGSFVMLVGGWRIVFAMQGFFAAALVGATYWGFQESLSPSLQQDIHPVALFNNYVGLLKNKSFLTYATIYGLAFACMFSFVSSSPLILIQKMHVSGSVFPYLFSIIATGTILGSAVSGILNQRKVRMVRLLPVGLGCMVLGSLLGVAVQRTASHGPAMLLPFLFLTFFGFGVTAPSVMMEALETIPHLAGYGSGALHLILRLCASGASAFLGIYATGNLPQAELATLLVMVATATAACALYGYHLRFLISVVATNRLATDAKV